MNFWSFLPQVSEEDDGMRRFKKGKDKFMVSSPTVSNIHDP